jgi:WhiB family transcriptional regulator, redox-sensing transcriptional regulator
MATTRRRQPSRPAPSWGWQDRAACRGQPLTVFFGADGERPTTREAREARAKAVCAGCPVRTECAEHALTAPEPAGVWGGLGEDERAAERRRRSRRAA